MLDRQFFAKTLPGIALAAAMALGVGQAQAIPAVNGSFAFGATGAETYVPNSISFTQFQFNSVKVGATQVGDFFTGGCCVTPLNTPLSSSTSGGATTINFDYTTTLQSIPGFLTWTDSAGDNFSYNVSSWFENTGAGNSAFLDTTGTLTEEVGGVSPFIATGPADANFSFNQTGSAVNGNGTFSSGSFATPTPEPASLLVLGSALAGLGLIRRRRR